MKSKQTAKQLITRSPDMLVRFVKDNDRQYSVVVISPDGGKLKMRPAPGFDEDLPHDLLHFIVEAELGLENGIFGQLAKGGDAGTFSVHHGNDRGGSRRRRKLKRKSVSTAR